MSINTTIEVKSHDAAILANRLEETGNIEGRKTIDDEDYPSVDKTDEAESADSEKGSYEGRKYDSKIDGPEQVSQETDEVYADPRAEAGLPPAGKNVADLTVDTLNSDDI